MLLSYICGGDQGFFLAENRPAFAVCIFSTYCKGKECAIQFFFFKNPINFSVISHHLTETFQLYYSK